MRVYQMWQQMSCAKDIGNNNNNNSHINTAKKTCFCRMSTTQIMQQLIQMKQHIRERSIVFILFVVCRKKNRFLFSLTMGCKNESARALTKKSSLANNFLMAQYNQHLKKKRKKRTQADVMRETCLNNSKKLDGEKGI